MLHLTKQGCAFNPGRICLFYCHAYYFDFSIYGVQGQTIERLVLKKESARGKGFFYQLETTKAVQTNCNNGTPKYGHTRDTHKFQISNE